MKIIFVIIIIQILIILAQKTTRKRVPIIPTVRSSEPRPKYFRIESMSSGLVLDLDEMDPCANARVILCKYVPGKQSQIWSWDDLTLLKNNYSGYYLDMKGGRDPGSQLILWPKYSGLNQKWVYQFHQQAYKNFLDLVMDIENAKNQVGSKVIGFPYHGGTNQKFRWIPVD